MVHAPAAYIKSGKRTVPFIEVTSSGKRYVVHDSTEIIKWVRHHFESVDVIPEDEATYLQAMSLEDRADSLGDDVIRYMYAPMIERPNDFVEVWGWGAKPLHRRLLRAGLPIVRSLLHNYLDFSASACAAGLSRLHDLFAELDQRLQNGRAYLVGDRLSIADLSVASLLAPIYAPKEHIVYSSPIFRAALLEQQSNFADYASFVWMQQLYTDYRSRTGVKCAVYKH